MGRLAAPPIKIQRLEPEFFHIIHGNKKINHVFFPTDFLFFKVDEIMIIVQKKKKISRKIVIMVLNKTIKIRMIMENKYSIHMIAKIVMKMVIKTSFIM